MAKTDFIPRSDPAYLVWHDQFLTALNSIGAGLDVTGAEIGDVTTQNGEIHTAVTDAETALATAQQMTQAKKATRSTSEQTARLLARRIKLHVDYTPAIGEQLGIEGPEDTTDLTNAKPKLTGTALPHSVMELKFNKSKADGVNIYSKREGDADFVYLARDTNSPYVDNRDCVVAGKPENRQYKAIYVVGDDEIGQASDIVTLVCLP